MALMGEAAGGCLMGGGDATSLTNIYKAKHSAFFYGRMDVEYVLQVSKLTSDFSSSPLIVLPPKIDRSRFSKVNIDEGTQRCAFHAMNLASTLSKLRRLLRTKQMEHTSRTFVTFHELSAHGWGRLGCTLHLVGSALALLSFSNKWDATLYFGQLLG